MRKAIYDANHACLVAIRQIVETTGVSQAASAFGLSEVVVNEIAHASKQKLHDWSNVPTLQFSIPESKLHDICHFARVRDFDYKFDASISPAQSLALTCYTNALLTGAKENIRAARIRTCASIELLEALKEVSLPKFLNRLMMKQPPLLARKSLLMMIQEVNSADRLQSMAVALRDVNQGVARQAG